MSADVVFVSILDGVGRGGLYFLLAIGIALVFGTMGIINFAHGSFIMLSAYAAWQIAFALDGVVGSFWIAAITSIIGVGLIGIVLERFVIRRMYKVDIVYQLLLFYSLVLIIDGLVDPLFGAYPRTLSFFLPSFLSGSIDLLGNPFSKFTIFIFFFSLAAGGSIWFILFRTRFGKSCRAVSEDREMAASLGIRVGRVFLVFLGIGMVLAGMAGSIGMASQSVTPILAINTIILCFVILVIGGMGSLLGALVASFILGISDSIATLFIPELRFALPYILMAVVLIIRPEGLFTRR